MDGNLGLAVVCALPLILGVIMAVCFQGEPSEAEVRIYMREISLRYRRADGKLIEAGTACCRYGIEVLHSQRGLDKQNLDHLKRQKHPNVRRPWIWRIRRKLCCHVRAEEALPASERRNALPNPRRRTRFYRDSIDLNP